VIGRRLFWRLSRFAYYKARNDLLSNSIGSNGEADLQRRVARHHAKHRSGENLVAVDVGANLGEWTLSMLDAAKAAGVQTSVHSFEPVPIVHEELLKRIAASPDADRVHCVPKCVGSEPGSAEMNLCEGLAGSHSVVRGVEGAETVTVPVTTIEAYCRENGIDSVDLLKIDAEGFDFEVILGALPLLREGKVGVLQFEYNMCWIDGRRFLKDVFDLAEELGLCVGKLVGGGIEIYPGWHSELERFIEGNFALGRREVLEAVGGVMGHFDESNTYAAD
jgi:FkbM family methyltransferase